MVQDDELALVTNGRRFCRTTKNGKELKGMRSGVDVLVENQSQEMHPAAGESGVGDFFGIPGSN